MKEVKSGSLLGIWKMYVIAHTQKNPYTCNTEQGRKQFEISLEKSLEATRHVGPENYTI